MVKLEKKAPAAKVSLGQALAATIKGDGPATVPAGGRINDPPEVAG
jgi:hypothetical protein